MPFLNKHRIIFPPEQITLICFNDKAQFLPIDQKLDTVKHTKLIENWIQCIIGMTAECVKRRSFPTRQTPRLPGQQPPLLLLQTKETGC